MSTLYVIKIGGNIIDDPAQLERFLADFAELKGNKILIHGGGKIATKLSQDLGIESKLIEGRRVTDAETLKVVTMVYAGLINKNIVAGLQKLNCNAIGLAGADGNIVRATKRPLRKVLSFGEDLGEVTFPVASSPNTLRHLLKIRQTMHNDTNLLSILEMYFHSRVLPAVENREHSAQCRKAVQGSL